MKYLFLLFTLTLATNSFSKNPPKSQYKMLDEKGGSGGGNTDGGCPWIDIARYISTESVEVWIQFCPGNLRQKMELQEKFKLNESEILDIIRTLKQKPKNAIDGHTGAGRASV